MLGLSGEYDLAELRELAEVLTMTGRLPSLVQWSPEAATRAEARRAAAMGEGLF